MEAPFGLLHLCRKAGKLILGQKAVLSHHSGGDMMLILLSADAGSVLKRKFSHCRTLTVGLSSEKLGEIFGRNRLSVLGIADNSFANEIEKLLKNESLLVV
jgi:ribosomal protein L7Ae-like RNA K-turn-binding protein